MASCPKLALGKWFRLFFVCGMLLIVIILIAEWVYESMFLLKLDWGLDTDTYSLFREATFFNGTLGLTTELKKL
jgi:hypothetical protein